MGKVKTQMSSRGAHPYSAFVGMLWFNFVFALKCSTFSMLFSVAPDYDNESEAKENKLCKNYQSIVFKKFKPKR